MTMATFKKAPKIQSKRERARQKNSSPQRSRSMERRTLLYAAGIAALVIALLYAMFTSV